MPLRDGLPLLLFVQLPRLLLLLSPLLISPPSLPSFLNPVADRPPVPLGTGRLLLHPRFRHWNLGKGGIFIGRSIVSEGFPREIRVFFCFYFDFWALEGPPEVEGQVREEMKVVVGSPGTWSGLALRIGQCLFAGASIGVMLSALGFSNYTAFCYLVASMGLQALWSLGLACLDMYALKVKRDLHNPLLVSLFVVGDWVTATLSLAAACSSAGVTVLFIRDVGFCKMYPQFSCDRYQISIAMAFITWLLVATSSLVMFWILASV